MIPKYKGIGKNHTGKNHPDKRKTLSEKIPEKHLSMTTGVLIR